MGLVKNQGPGGGENFGESAIMALNPVGGLL